MATFKLKLVVFTLLLVGMLLINLWVSPASNPDRILGGPTAALATPLTEEETKAEAEVDTTMQYQTWQELAYFSKLFASLAHTYRALERKAVGEEKYLISPIGDDVMFRWKDPCQVHPDTCLMSVQEFGICAAAMRSKIDEVIGRMVEGIAVAEKLLGPSAPVKFKNANLKLYVPDEKWLESGSEK